MGGCAVPGNRKRIFLAVQSTDVLKHWPADRWQRIVRWLVESKQCEVVLCGGPADAAALAVRMDLCLGIDTGLVHLASSVGVPAVVLVGPTDPNRWSPWRTGSIVLRSSRVKPTFTERVLTAIGATDHLRWPLGTAATADIPVAAVEAAVGCLLGAGAASDPQVFDLTDGSFRYEVFASPPAAASPPGMPAAAAVPAT
jgi:hypothetical protein